MVSLCKQSGNPRKQKHFLVKEGCTPPAGLQVSLHCLCVKLSLYTKNMETAQHKLQSYIISLFHKSFHSEPQTLINAEISIILVKPKGKKGLGQRSNLGLFKWHRQFFLFLSMEKEIKVVDINPILISPKAVS